MPPIEIVAELWIDQDRYMSGCMHALTYKGHPQMGVKLPAPTALVENETLLEGIVAHEFLHCFHLLRKVIAVNKRGGHVREDFFDRHSREEDDKRLAPIADWFHEEIDIPQHNDPRGGEVKKYIRELSEELPIRTMPGRYEIHSIGIPTDIREHVELLLKSEQTPPSRTAPASSAP
jgi:hypothetical protein